MSLGFNLKACNLPDSSLGFTNRVYVSPGDFSNLIGVLDDGSVTNAYIDVKGCIFSMSSHKGIATGGIALNKAQREYARIGLNAELFVKRFVPPANFELGACKIEVDFFLPQQQSGKTDFKHEDLEKVFTERFKGQPLAKTQPLVLDYESLYLKFTVLNLQPVDVSGDGSAASSVSNGLLASHTEIDFQQGPSGKCHVLSNKIQQRSIFRPDFNFEELGIGGLDKEFGNIFRRAFAARVFPPQVIRDLGIKHVRGMLLHGPPGTGKTLIARQLAKFLKAAEPKIVNGPEILNKYVGQAEENIRNLFADAEKEQTQQGENSQLHVVIFDEIDSICKSRGSKSDSTGVHDSIVNQLLSKIDGVNALNNILLIGMTNRKDLIDDALLRPGRLEVHVEISLPDEHGRQQILNIHTKDMQKAGYLDPSVSIAALAAQTKNFSGAELEGLIRSATSFALNRKVDVQDLNKTKDMGKVTVINDDFEEALLEIKPMFGCHEDEFEMCISRHGIMHFSSDFEQMLRSSQHLVEQVRSSENTPLLSMLFYGSPGCGKTALSAFLASKSDYPFVRRIGSETFVGYSENAKVSAITKIFEDAYKSPLSVIVLDDLERLMDYVPIGPRFSTFVMSCLFALLKKRPPMAGRRLLIIGTTSAKDFLQETDMFRVFNVALHVPLLTAPEEFKFVLEKLSGFTQQVVQEICADMAANKRAIGIRTLLLVAEMALQRQDPIGKQVFMECLRIAGDA